MTENPEINPTDSEIEEEVPEPGSNEYYRWLQAKQFEERNEQRKLKVSNPPKRKKPAEEYPGLYSSRMMPITKSGENRNRSKR